MHGWEAVMAALGGLLLGLGLGVGASGRRARLAAQAREDVERRARALTDVALPWLRAHATTLGAPPETTIADRGGDPLETTRALIDTITRCEREDLLPYSDTMELDALALKGESPTQRGLP
ncbi:MAG: hypothetical protein KC668_00550 [Myxococcales bacterium]|nr:hypothetical protein [Myxococcales bacterium]